MLMNPEADLIAKILEEERVPVVTTGAGSPEKIYETLEKPRGIKSDPGDRIGGNGKTYGTGWRRCRRRGGHGSRGHIGENTTMVLVPQIVDAVTIPVIAAGGIADGRTMAAALMLGAEGVQMGTAFIATKEAAVHERYKACIVRAKDIDSRVTGRSTGHPVRTLRNPMTKEYLRLEKTELRLKSWNA